MIVSGRKIFASPLEAEVGPQVRVGGTIAAFSLLPAMRRDTPHPALRADLPLKGGGEERVRRGELAND